jgi:uncharacterized membrane protein
MNLWLILAFLFFIGSVLGWVAELIFRRFFSAANPERKWINPGFCVGPYVPLYGFGLCLLYLIASAEAYNWITNPVWNRIVLFAFMAVCMTGIEYLAGLTSLKFLKVRLWDYTNQWGNIQGLICPKFSAVWAAVGAIYYFLIHPHILNALNWLSENLAFSFFVGLFFGVFIIDVVYSAKLVSKLRAFARENDIVVRYEHLKAEIRNAQDAAAQRSNFLFAFRSDRALGEHLAAHRDRIRELRDTLEQLKSKD